MTRHQTDYHQRSSKLAGSQHSSANSHNQHNYHPHGANSKVTFEPFHLLSPGDQSLKQAAELVEAASLNRFRVCVVSIISKDSLDATTKHDLVQSLFGGKGNSSNNNKFNSTNSNNKKKVQRAKSSKGPTSSKDSSEEIHDGDVPNSSGVANENINDVPSGKIINDYENQVVGKVDCKAGVVVLNLTSFLETDKLYSLYETVDALLRGGLEATQTIQDENSWPKWNQNLLKTMLILFVVSHIVVFYNPEPSIDYNLIQTLKMLEILRLKSQTRITDLLETIASKQMFSSQWIRQGRVACPRALFVCGTDCLDVVVSQSASDIVNTKRDLEDLVYKLLKKTNIISRPTGIVSSQASSSHTSLICLPERDDFVFLLARHHHNSSNQQASQASRDLDVQKYREVNEFYASIFMSLDKGNSCTKARENNFESGHHIPAEEPGQDGGSENIGDQSQRSVWSDAISSEATTAGQVGSGCGGVPFSQTSTYHHSRFKKFLSKHISEVQAVAQVDLDHTTKHHGGSTKQSNGPLLPRLDDFFTVLLKLKNLLFPEPTSTAQPLQQEASSNAVEPTNDDSNAERPTYQVTCWQVPDERRFIDIYDMLNTDELFSKRHCHKTRLAAFDFYLRGMQVPPTIQATHENSLDSARRLYLNHARGFACEANLNQLVDQCNQYWQNLSQSRALDDASKESRFHKRGGRVSRTKSSEIAPTTNNQTGDCLENFGSRSSLTILRRANGIKMTTSCECGRESKFLISPVDRKKKLERVDIHRVND